MIRPCDACGQPYEAKRGRSRFCSARCRNRAHRAPAVVIPLGDPSEPSALVAAVERQLSDAGQLDTVLGRLALGLAEQMSAPGQTGSAVATVSKELRVVMAEVTASSRAPDIVDELRRRRDARWAHLS